MPTPIQTDKIVTDESLEVVQSDKKDDILSLARLRFSRAVEFEGANRQSAVEDLKFKNGEQWPNDIKSTRTIEKRPCLVINKMKTFVHQVTNAARQNRPAIKISPVGDGSDKQVATMLQGLIRQIERQSNADIAYDTALDSAATMGWGYWRIITDYEEPNSFNQAIRIVRFRNPMRVYLDPDHQEPDGSDSKWAFITDLIPRAEFQQRWPKADQVEFDDGTLGDEYRHWSTTTHIRIAEYYYFRDTKRKLLQLIDGRTVFEDELGEDERKLLRENDGAILKEREVIEPKQTWCLLTAHDILEEREWPSKWIPIVKVIGDEVDIEGRVTYAGVIRDAKDPQRMKNYWATNKTELIALAPKAPYIMEEGQVEGHERRWQNANEKSYPYLLYKGTSVANKPAPAPMRQQYAGPPAGVIEAEQAAEQDMMATTGIRFDATKQERIPDESGRALRELKVLGELGSYHYMDNLARALKHTGRILIELIPKYYDTRRVVTILREDDQEQNVTIEPRLAVPYQSVPNLQKQAMEELYNPNLGKYDVTVTIGPSYATKRAEAAENMIAFMQTIPNAAPVIAGPIAKNQDWPGADQIAERLDALVPPQVLSKGMNNFPPEAKALINALQTQMGQMQQQLQMASAQLQNEDKDRAVEVHKANQDFEAKMTKIAADMEAKLMTAIGGRDEMIAESVNRMSEILMNQAHERNMQQMGMINANQGQ